MNGYLSFLDPVQKELDEVESAFKKAGSSDDIWVNKLLETILNSGGKRTRPAITLLAGKMFNYSETLHIPMAVATELLHTASLVHDDTVDNAPLRRNNKTINASYGNNVAILLGDYIFATAAETVCLTDNVRVIQIFSRTLRLLADGELREIDQAFEPSSGFSGYWGRIERKTASLFATSAECGAILGGASEGQIENLKNYGSNIGTAFQIIDDILDFDIEGSELGKPLGQDLRQGVLTLPILIYLDSNPEEAQGIRKLKTLPGEEKASNIQNILSKVKNSGAIEKSFDIAKTYAQKGIEAIETSPKGAPRNSLQSIAQFVIERKF